VEVSALSDPINVRSGTDEAELWGKGNGIRKIANCKLKKAKCKRVEEGKMQND